LFDDRVVVDDVASVIVGNGGVEDWEQCAGKDEAGDFFEFG
jgi:hypothetical protein